MVKKKASPRSGEHSSGARGIAQPRACCVDHSLTGNTTADCIAYAIDELSVESQKVLTNIS